MKKAENQRIALTKKLLKDALVEMLSQTEIGKIHIRALCEKAGINRSTFYKYYGSQYDLFEEMEKDMLYLIEDKLRDCRSVYESMIAICSYLEKNRNLTLLLINNNIDSKFPEKLFGLPALKNEINSYLDKGYTDAEKVYIISFLTYGYYQMFGQWINKEVREPVEDFVAIVLNLQRKVLNINK